MHGNNVKILYYCNIREYFVDCYRGIMFRLCEQEKFTHF